MTSTPITELDFFRVKQQLKDYLRGQSRFKDYDFEGSNISVLLDILAYNTYHNNFYANMAFSEMFLDSAQLKNSIVSQTKELNYLPRSRTSSRATVNLTITTNESNTQPTYFLPKTAPNTSNTTLFTARANNKTYTFVTDKAYIGNRVGNQFNIEGVEIFEGKVISERFLQTENNSKFTISNENVDIDSIRVFVFSSQTGLQEEYTRTLSIFGVTEQDTVFYLESEFNDQYSINFGKGVFGKNPEANDVVIVEYRVCSAEEPNGITAFTSNLGRVVLNPTSNGASGGAERESIEEIKIFAPKSIQIQERAVTEKDYEVLLKQNFPEIQAIAVYGGDRLEPPRYGKVAISVNTFEGGGVSESNKLKYKNFIVDKTPLTIEPIFVDPEFTKVEVICDVSYSIRRTAISIAEITQKIRDAIIQFNTANLNQFGANLRYSKLISNVESIDSAITSNEIALTPYIEYLPSLNVLENPQFKFGQELKIPYQYNSQSGFSNYKPSVTSTQFTYKNTLCSLQDDGNGNIQIISSTTIVEQSIGTVDYTTGTIRLINFIISNYEGNSIRIKVVPKDLDIIAPKSRILLIDDKDITVNATQVP